MRRHLAFAFVVVATLGLQARGAPTDVSPAAEIAANALANAISQQDNAALHDLVNLNAMLDKITAGVSAPPKFEAGFKSGFLGVSQPFASIVNVIKQGGQYKLLHTMMKDGAPHAMCRMIQKSGAVNYHDWTLATRADGKVVATDVYIAALGDKMSTTMHRLYLMGAAEADPSIVQRIMGTDNRAVLEHMNDFTALSAAMQAGQWQDAARAYADLPKELQDEKEVQVMHILVEEHLSAELPGHNPALFDEAVDRYQHDFAGDPSVDLICLDGWLRKKDFAKCYAAIDRIQAWTGGDAYVDVLRAGIIQIEAKPTALQDAEKCFRKAVADEPTLLVAHLALIKNLTAQDDFAEAVQALQDTETRFGSRVTVERMPALASLVTSDAYKAYRERNVH